MKSRYGYACKPNRRSNEKVVNGMSPAQLRETDQFKGKDEMGLAEMAKAMSGSKFKQVMEDAEVGDNVKQKLKTARFGEFKRLIKDAADPRSRTSSDSRTELARWSTSDFEMSGVLDPDADRNLRASRATISGSRVRTRLFTRSFTSICCSELNSVLGFR